MRGLTFAGIALAFLNAMNGAVSHADDVDVDTTQSAFTAGVTASTGRHDKPIAQSDMPPGHWQEEPVCSLGGDHICGTEGLCQDGSVMVMHEYVLADDSTYSSYTNCPAETKSPKPHLTVADIRTAFEKIPMSASAVHIQPPDGETLVNFDTIFYSDPMTLDRSMTLVGQKVDFHITVASYTWHFGDGRTETTKDPGAAYPHQSITHRYLRKGTVNVSLDTTYQADYRVNGGPQQHLDDTVTIAGGGHPLTVRTATPHLVGE